MPRPCPCPYPMLKLDYLSTPLCYFFAAISLEPKIAFEFSLGGWVTDFDTRWWLSGEENIAKMVRVSITTLKWSGNTI